MRKSKLVITIIISSILLFIFLLFSFLRLKRSDENLKIINLSEVTRSIFYCPQYIAMELGYFEQEGLKINITTSEGSDKTMTALLSGHSDISLMGAEMVIYVYNENRENYPILFAQLTKKDGSFFVGRKNENFSWENLKGKSIIAGRKGGLPEMVLEYVLRNHNLEPGKDVNLIKNIKFDLMPSAFLSGAGDYVMLFEPTASIFEKEKNCYILQSVGSQCEDITYTCYCATQSYIKSNPETIKGFTRAIYKSQLWIYGHTAEETAKAVNHYFSGVDNELISKSIKICKDIKVWAENPIIKKENFNNMLKIVKEAGELSEEVEFDKVVDIENNMYKQSHD
ncbi:MAG: ABC transporter substrate-binding protein [Candidatus Paraimprobicoccus trichonymphae]|uniref:ABC transporter substrate-binding protein n=1 Tax=Candidatus Paraimprobicoccus trichonymphae TaxID=3033793 RepID=A0AA48I5V3_9FIRM|nr:MAG: ABC transporter substrate-binding protein [Candidatus Paraimprobicoccus trichonymphae]